MRNEKDFFKWSFGLRFLFVSLCALMCVGNAWGAKYYGKITITAKTVDADDNVDTNHKGGLVNAQAEGSGYAYFFPNNALTNFKSTSSTSGAKSVTSTTSSITRYMAYLCYRGYKLDKCDDLQGWKSGASNQLKAGSLIKNTTANFGYYTPYTYYSGKVAFTTANNSTTNAAVATATAVFKPNDNYITVNFQQVGIEDLSYTLHTNTLVDVNNQPTAFSINHGDQSVKIYDNESLTFEYVAEGYKHEHWWVSTDGGTTKHNITVVEESSNNHKMYANLYTQAQSVLGASFYNKMTLTFGVEFSRTPYHIYLEVPELFSYTVTHRRALANVSDPITMTTSGSLTDIYPVYYDDSIYVTRAYDLPRGYKYDRYYKRTTSGGEKKTVYGAYRPEFQYGGSPYASLRNFTSDLYIGVDFVMKESCNITYLLPEHGSYTVEGDDNDRPDYPEITVGGAPVITYEGDKIKPTARPYRDATTAYQFKQWYTTTDGGANKTKRTPDGNSQLDVYSFGTCSFGAEFEQRTGGYNVNYQASENGTYTAVGDKDTKGATYPTIATDGSSTIATFSDDQITLTATPAEGYCFYRFYYIKDGKKATLGDLFAASQKLSIPANATAVGAEFSNAPFYIGGVFAEDLQSAIQAAQSEIKGGAQTSTIILAGDATVEAGNYTIPEKVVLLIPYKAEQLTAGPIGRIDTDEIPSVAYRTLTLKNGAHLEVKGTIEVSGVQTTGTQGKVTIARPGGTTYGLMLMNSGSSITLNGGSQFNVWGFVQGEGTIDVRRDAVVREQFQINDWKTLLTTCYMAQGGCINYRLHVLPINQYFIQNVEVKAKYHPGAKLYGQVSANVAGMKLSFNDVGIIGVKYSDTEKEHDSSLKDDVAVFLMNNADNSEDTWVCKSYDVAHDVQLYEVNNSAYLGSLSMYIDFEKNGFDIDLSEFGFGEIEGIDVDSRDFALPLTNNFKIHLLSGDLLVTQNTELLPGAVIEINKKSTMTIAEKVWNDEKNDGLGGWDNIPQTLYLYDADQWGAYVSTGVSGSVSTITDLFSGHSITFGYGSRITFRPGGLQFMRKLSPAEGLKDAQLIVHGTVDVKGYLKTTYGDYSASNPSKKSDGGVNFTKTSHANPTGGAAIISTIADAGTIIFTQAAQSVSSTLGSDYVWQINAGRTNAEPPYVGDHVVPAWLTNDVGSAYSEADGFTETADAPAGKSFCFIDVDNDGKGEWVSLTTDGCFVYDGTDYYAKPKEYVALANGKTANADHTFSDKAGQGRLFILVDDCQWWEVEKKDNLYHCVNRDNDTYYYWDNNKHKWREKEFAITWVNWNGDALGEEESPVVYPLHYGITPKYLEDKNPTRPDDVDYTYNFIGWTPEIVPVTGDATYTAKYQAIQKKYTIIFKDQNDEEIERQQLALGETPSAPDISSIENSYWNPAIAVVSGNATYQVATYTETPSTFTVTWANYNGTPISSDQVTKDDKPVYSGSAPVKNLNNEYNYTWTGWQSPAGTYSKTATLPDVTANITYTATFSVEPKKYNINFYDENDNQLGSTQNLAFGADPVVPKYSKAATAQYTYTLKWYDDEVTSDPEEEAMVNVPTVTRDANYKAYFTETLNKYTVTLQSNLPGKCSFTGAGTYDYNTDVTIAATPAEGYEFVKWIEREGDANLGTLPLTSDITLTAVLKESAAATPENLNVNNGEINVPAAANYMDLTIFSDGTETSGQLTGATNVTLLGNANFVFKKNIKAGYWYSFAVPWRVDAQSGVYFGGSNTPAVLGKDFEIVYYDGAVRAAQGKVDACWVYLKNLSTKKILEPGKAYMIFIKHGSQSQIVFRKKVQEPLLTTSVTVEQYNASDVRNANWNAIANPALYNAYIYAGDDDPYIYAGDDDPKGFYYISENDEFDWYHLNAEKLVVGEAVYIQAPEAGTIVVNNSSYAPVAAPRRERAEQATSFDVQIAAAGATKRADHISVQIDEDKEENKYVIGKDLTKFGVSARVAQMWIDRYDVKLCFNTIAPEGDATSFPMSIYAPKAGTYTIAIEREVATEDYALYLTYNGEAIWNLSEGAYTANLNKGTDANYGLRISAKAPQVVTGVDEAVVDAKGETKKVLINNQVFIIRGEKVYTIDGQLVK